MKDSCVRHVAYWESLLDVSDDGTSRVNLWWLRSWALFIVWYSERTATFRKLDIFSSPGEMVGKHILSWNIRKSLSPSINRYHCEAILYNGSSWAEGCPLFHGRTETDPVSETLYYVGILSWNEAKELSNPKRRGNTRNKFNRKLFKETPLVRLVRRGENIISKEPDERLWIRLN